MNTSTANVSMSVLKTVQTNPSEFVDKLPAHGVEWALRETDLSWAIFRKLRDDSGDKAFEPVRDEGDYTVWMTTRALDACVRDQHGDVLVTEV